MKDRIPTPGQEGRVLITPENGDPPFYATVAMADNPSEDGTPLRTATLLKDATAALFGLDATAVPDDVLSWLGKYNQHWWARMATTSHWEIQMEAAKEITFEYVNLEDNQIVYGTDAVVDEDGAITLLNQSTLTLTSTQSEWESAFRSLVGKYVYFPTWVSEEEPSAARPYFVNAITAFEIDDFTGGYSIIFTGARPVTSVWVDGSSGVWTYVQASDRNAYPDFGIEDNYEYKYLGVPFDNAVTAPKIAVVSYVGTGVAGEENACSLTFDFAPKYLICDACTYPVSSGEIRMKNELHGYYAIFIPTDALPVDSYIRQGGNGYVSTKKSEDGKTITWYGSEAQYQRNVASYTYYVLAIG